MEQRRLLPAILFGAAIMKSEFCFVTRRASANSRLTLQQAVLGVLVLVFTSYSVATLGQSIANPSFETPEVSPGALASPLAGAGWQFNTGLTSQEFSGIAGYDPTASNDFHPIAPPPDGDQYGFMESDSSMQQTISGFTIGQAYRLDWAQGYGGTEASGGSAVTVQLEPSGGGPAQTIAPLELANSPSLAARSSDVFIATSETYELIVQSSDQVPFGYAFRNSLVDQFSFVPVSEPATVRTTHSATLALTSTSEAELDALLGGVSLGSTINSAMVGSIDLEFDLVNGTDVANLRFNASELSFDPLLTTFIDGGPLGTADVTIADSKAILFHTDTDFFGDPFGKHKVAVDSNGEFLLGSAFVGLGGDTSVELEGPISDIFGVDLLEVDLSTIPPADLGITYALDETIFADPGTIALVPTGNLDEYEITIDIPVLAITVLDSGIGLELKLSGYAQAQGIFVVPEPTGLVLALMGITLVGFVHRHRHGRR